jgi:hypothetical protein
LSKIILMTKMLKKIKIEGDDHGIGATQWSWHESTI